MDKLDKKAVYSRLFNSEDGKKVLNELCRLHYINGTTFSADPFRNAYNEGQRSVVIRILNIIKGDNENG